MTNFLTTHNVQFNESETKAALWLKIQPLLENGQKKYFVDELLKQHGIGVLRLAPYHCQHNAIIEMIWAYCKGLYNKCVYDTSLTFEDKDPVMAVWLRALTQCTPEIWEQNVNHVKALIENDCRKHMGNTSYANIPPFIVSLAEDSETDDAFSDESDDGDSSDKENEAMV